MQAPLPFPLRGQAADADSARPERTVASLRAAPAVCVVAALAALLASLGLVGGDALWLVSVGGEVAHGRLPGSISFATAPSHGWHDVPALAELLFWAAYHVFGGARGLVLVQVVAVAVAFGALARGLKRESTVGSAVLVSTIVLLGAPAAVLVTSVGALSLPFFSLLLALLHSETRSPSRRIWWAVPLVALWGNLHGGVLAGIGLLACYLVVARLRREPLVALGVLLGAGLALFANPTVWHTPAYYGGVLHSEVARRGVQLWAPLGFGVIDVLLIAATVVLGVMVITRPRLHLWEAVALAGLTAGTVHVSRNGVWLLFVAAYPAARALRVRGPRPPAYVVAAAALALAAAALVVRGPHDPAANAVARTAAATGQPVLAEGILGQQVVLAGGRVWLDNPIDAFTRADQALYLDWLDGRPAGDAAVSHARYVLVAPASPAGRRAAADRRLVRIAANANASLYRVR
jgi:hypothetical protein